MPFVRHEGACCKGGKYKPKLQRTFIFATDTVGSKWGRKMGTRFLVAALAATLAGCASTQLTYNTVDLSHSVQDIVTAQVLFNLSIIADKPQAVPTQVALTAGSASTTNSVTPSVSVPFNPATQAANNIQTTLGATGAITQSQVQNNTQLTKASLGGTLQAVDSWVQNWSYTPVVDPDQLRRLRTLYNFALFGDNQGYINLPQSRLTFIDEYPLVRKAISLTYGGNSNNPSPPAGTPYCPTLWRPEGGGTEYHCNTLTASVQIPDELYLEPPTCVLCLTGQADSHYRGAASIQLNPRIKKHLHGWLKFDIFDRDRDEYLGTYGSHAIYIAKSDRWKLAEFTMFVLSATKDGNNPNGTGAASSSSKGAASSAVLIDGAGNVQTLINP